MSKKGQKLARRIMRLGEEEKPLGVWARENGFSRQTICYRIDTKGMSLEAALSCPPGEAPRVRTVRRPETKPRKVYECSRCGRPGHRAPGCPQVAVKLKAA